jgi:hypothetical protein
MPSRPQLLAGSLNQLTADLGIPFDSLSSPNPIGREAFRWNPYRVLLLFVFGKPVSTFPDHALAPCLSMISAQTRSAFVVLKRKTYTPIGSSPEVMLFRIMLYRASVQRVPRSILRLQVDCGWRCILHLRQMAVRRERRRSRFRLGSRATMDGQVLWT